jgi:hypothetical protein
VATWPELPEAIRAGILAMVKASKTRTVQGIQPDIDASVASRHASGRLLHTRS